MKTKYRIVSQPSLIYPEYTWYRAQYKFFNLIWRDCFPEPNRPGLYTSMDIENVERFVEAKINNEYRDISSKVIKVYE
jgi:(2Fe-2S) ferredoxin